MSPIDPALALPAIAGAFLLALATAAWLARRHGVPADDGRTASLDGLRGLLAFMVFLHHGVVAHAWLRSGAWVAPRSVLITQFGQSSVVLFFMVTGCLFGTRLLAARGERFDWLRLYVGRLLRLAPLYLVAMAGLALSVGVVTGFALRVPAAQLGGEAMHWLAFGLLDTPDLNRMGGTTTVMAGAVWTLRWEWLFYLALPLLAPLAGVRTSPALMLASAAALLALDGLRPSIHLLSFAGGLAAALLQRWAAWRRIAPRPTLALVSLACLGTSYTLPATAYAWPSVLALALGFAPIAAGNGLFGMLGRPACRVLGEASYGVYLLHGLVLYWAFRLLPGASRFGAATHWAVLLALTPMLVLLAHASWRHVEQPALRRAGPLTAWLRARARNAVPPAPGAAVADRRLSWRTPRSR